MTEEALISEEDIALSTPLRVQWRETFHRAKKQAVAQFEQTYLKDLLLTYGGNITKAAQAAGKHRRAFWQLMRKHGIGAHSLTALQAPDLDKC